MLLNGSIYKLGLMVNGCNRAYKQSLFRGQINKCDTLFGKIMGPTHMIKMKCQM